MSIKVLNIRPTTFKVNYIRPGGTPTTGVSKPVFINPIISFEGQNIFDGTTLSGVAWRRTLFYARKPNKVGGTDKVEIFRLLPPEVRTKRITFQDILNYCNTYLIDGDLVGLTLVTNKGTYETFPFEEFFVDPNAEKKVNFTNRFYAFKIDGSGVAYGAFFVPSGFNSYQMLAYERGAYIDKHASSTSYFINGQNVTFSNQRLVFDENFFVASFGETQTQSNIIINSPSSGGAIVYTAPNAPVTQLPVTIWGQTYNIPTVEV